MIRLSARRSSLVSCVCRTELLYWAFYAALTPRFRKCGICKVKPVSLGNLIGFPLTMLNVLQAAGTLVRVRVCGFWLLTLSICHLTCHSGVLTPSLVVPPLAESQGRNGERARANDPRAAPLALLGGRDGAFPPGRGAGSRPGRLRRAPDGPSTGHFELIRSRRE